MLQHYSQIRSQAKQAAIHALREQASEPSRPMKAGDITTPVCAVAGLLRRRDAYTVDRGVTVHETGEPLAQLFEPCFDPGVHRTELELANDQRAQPRQFAKLQIGLGQPYVPKNRPAISDLFDLFDFDHCDSDNR